jgi:hypothetical protein
MKERKQTQLLGEHIFFAGKLKIYVNLIFLMYQKLSRKVHREIDGLKEYLYIHVSKKWRDWGFNPASASHGQKTLSLTPGGCAEHSLVKTCLVSTTLRTVHLDNRLCFFGLPHWWIEQQRIWPVFVRNNCHTSSDFASRISVMVTSPTTTKKLPVKNRWFHPQRPFLPHCCFSHQSTKSKFQLIKKNT